MSIDYGNRTLQQICGILSDRLSDVFRHLRNVPNRHLTVTFAGYLDGSTAMLVRRFDGTDWSVLFNTDYGEGDELLSDLIDPLVHGAADAVESWPDVDFFPEYFPDAP